MYFTLKTQQGSHEPDEYAAVFSERMDDAEWEFQMCVAVGLLTGGEPMDADEFADAAADLVRQCSNNELADDRLLVVFSADPDFPSVYEATEDELDTDEED
jgi:hypothetical protein